MRVFVHAFMDLFLVSFVFFFGSIASRLIPIPYSPFVCVHGFMRGNANRRNTGLLVKCVYVSKYHFKCLFFCPVLNELTRSSFCDCLACLCVCSLLLARRAFYFSLCLFVEIHPSDSFRIGVCPVADVGTCS